MNPFRLVGRSNRQKQTGETPSKLDSRVRNASPFALTPLTGRDTEFSLLQDRWEQAQEGMGQIVLVLGQPGLGKSRLVQTLTQRVQEEATNRSSTATGESASASVDQDSMIIEWRCSQHFQNSELHPVSDYLERFLGAGRDPSPAARFDRLAQHLEDCDLCRPEVVALFAKLLFLPPDERYSTAALTPAREREETFRALRQWLRACSGKRSVLFVVEDLHWIDASTLEFLGHFIRRGPARSNPHRAHLPSGIQNSVAGAGSSNDLGAQSPDAAASSRVDAKRCGRSVAGVVGRANLPTAPAACRCWSRSSLGWLRESTVFESDSRWTPPRRSAASPKELPQTLQELVMARLDRMSSNREVAQFAATLGPRV